MLTIKKILHPTDFTPCAEGALRHAEALAQRFEAELYFLHVMPGIGADTFFDLDDMTGFEPAEAAQWAPIATQMETLLQPSRDQVPVHRVGGYGTLAGPAIVDYAAQTDVDLMVLGACGKGEAETGLGNTAREAIHRASCPVLTVGRQAATKAPVRIAHVLAPVDPEKSVINEIRYANDLARVYQARLSLLHVLERNAHAAEADEALRQMQEAARMHLHTYFARSLQHLRASGIPAEPAEDVEAHVLVGLPGDAIVRFAYDQDVDLIVISMRRPAMASGGGADLVEFIAARAPCPVLSVNEVGKTRTKVVKSGKSAATYKA